jgi:hypothetical protein
MLEFNKKNTSNVVDISNVLEITKKLNVNVDSTAESHRTFIESIEGLLNGTIKKDSSQSFNNKKKPSTPKTSLFDNPITPKVIEYQDPYLGDSENLTQRIIDFWKYTDFSTRHEAKDASIINNESMTQEINQNMALLLLKIPPSERTQTEIKTLYSQLRLVKVFSTLSKFMLEQLSTVVLYVAMDAERVVFRQGDVGTSWFVILKGSVSVNISKFSDVRTMQTVAVLAAGQGFGDLALVNDKPRAATIITREPCVFAKVEKSDYNRILKSAHQRDVRDCNILII